MIPTKQDRDMLFSMYDADGSGAITYKELAAAMFGDEKKGAVNVNKQRSPEELAEVLKTKLTSRGARGFIGLQR
jgi:Ca2+-binding EF-hand superfamily protein